MRESFKSRETIRVQLIKMADNKVYRASTTAPVNIAVVKSVPVPQILLLSRLEFFC